MSSLKKQTNERIFCVNKTGSNKLCLQNRVNKIKCQQSVSTYACKKPFDVSDKGYTQRLSIAELQAI